MTMMVANGMAVLFKRLLSNNLIDLSRPVLENSSQIMRSFLSFALERDEMIEMDKIEIIVSLMTPEMINRPNSLGITPLEVAIRRGNLELVRKLVEFGADMNATREAHGKTPFIKAVISKQIEIVDYLFGTGKANVNLVFKEDKSIAINIITFTLESKYIEIMFKSCSIDSNFFFKYMRSLKRHGNALIYKFILQNAKSFGSQNIQFILLSLARNAVLEGDFELLKLMHSVGISMDFIYPSVKYPKLKIIHYVAINGNVEMFNFLIDTVGLDINDPAENGLIPLTFAWNDDKIDLVKEIIKKGSRLDLNVNHIEFAIKCNNIQIIDAILSSPVEIDKLILQGGQNLVTIAVILDRPEILSKLIDSGRFDLMRPDALGQIIFTMRLPETTSEAVKNIIIGREADFLAYILSDD